MHSILSLLIMANRHGWSVCFFLFFCGALQIKIIWLQSKMARTRRYWFGFREVIDYTRPKYQFQLHSSRGSGKKNCHVKRDDMQCSDDARMLPEVKVEQLNLHQDQPSQYQTPVGEWHWNNYKPGVADLFRNFSVEWNERIFIVFFFFCMRKIAESNVRSFRMNIFLSIFLNIIVKTKMTACM